MTFKAISCHFSLYRTFRESTASNQMRLDTYYLGQKHSPGTLVLRALRVIRIALSEHHSGGYNWYYGVQKVGDFRHVPYAYNGKLPDWEFPSVALQDTSGTSRN